MWIVIEYSYNTLGQNEFKFLCKHGWFLQTITIFKCTIISFSYGYLSYYYNTDTEIITIMIILSPYIITIIAQHLNIATPNKSQKFSPSKVFCSRYVASYVCLLYW